MGQNIQRRNFIKQGLVASPDHWRALHTIYACQAGKDVYVENPIATSIAERRAMVRAALKVDRFDLLASDVSERFQLNGAADRRSVESQSELCRQLLTSRTVKWRANIRPKAH